MPTETPTPSREPPREGRNVGIARQMAMATELPFILVACVVVGGLIGVGIDRLLHTGPYGMLVFGVAGFAAGVRDVLRRLAPTRTRGGTNQGAKPPEGK